MIKEQLWALNLLCFVTTTIYAESVGLVNEFEIEDSNNGTNKDYRDHSNLTNSDLLIKYIAKNSNLTSNETQAKNNITEKGTLLHDSSMYTESDLEETTSSDKIELDGPDTKEKEANYDNEKHKGNEETKKTEISSVYTESDLEATTSQDNKKHGDNHERDKRSAGSYLFVPHKRDVTDAEHEEGSGEGSGQEPVANGTL